MGRLRQWDGKKANKAAAPNGRPRFAFHMMRQLECVFLRSTFAVAAVGEPQR
jgi:hypothetical protein